MVWRKRTPYVPLVVPRISLVPVIDFGWLQANKENLLMTMEVVKNAQAWSAALVPATQIAADLGSLVYELIPLDERTDVTEEVITEMTLAAGYGYRVAWIERVSGWVKTGQTHVAAHCAICMYRSASGEASSLLVGFAARAGHYYGRTHAQPPRP